MKRLLATLLVACGLLFVPVSSAAPASATTTAITTNYIFNGNNFNVGVLNANPDTDGYNVLGPLKSTDESPYFWNHAYGIAWNAYACVLTYYNSGELGWHFFHQYQLTVAASVLYRDPNFNWQIVIHRDQTCT